MPEGINKVHALNFIHELRSYIINDSPSFTRHYLQIYALNLPKIHNKLPFLLPVSSPVSCSTKFTVKLMT